MTQFAEIPDMVKQALDLHIRLQKIIMFVVNPGYKFMFILHCHIQTHEMLRLEHGSVTFQPLLDDNYDSPTDQPANRLIALLPGCSSRR